MKKLIVALLLFSPVMSVAGKTIQCTNVNSTELVATIESEDTFPAPLELLNFKIPRDASGTITLHEKGEKIPVNVRVEDGIVLRAGVTGTSGIMVHRSGAGFIWVDSKVTMNLWCDGPEKWPELAK